ncbi:GGDEF domain-containing protein [Marinobacter sp. C2H3]|uniref:GGDEF domain-containing protein n=1 Tax=Marinobacter sp. C2H3 TaxID=3119003 RepID=UPI00300F2D14
MPLSYRHRRQLLRLLLGVTALLGVIFAVVNLFAGKHGLMTIELALTLVVLLLLPIVKATHHLRRWCLCYIIALYVVTLYALALPITSITVFSWVMVMPVTTYLLLGRKLGGLFSAAYLAIAAGLFLWRFGATVAASSPGAIANVLAVVAWGYMFSHFYEASRERAEERLSQQALTDSLTGLANRTQLEQAFQRITSERALPLSVLMLDLDYFKRINDDHGRAAGDMVLQHVADVLRAQVRRDDIACRLGGEEFCVLLPRTGHDDACRLAERLREAIEAQRCQHNGIELALTTSIGIASSEVPEETLATLMHRADEKLYQAKAAGRNRIAGQ